MVCSWPDEDVPFPHTSHHDSTHGQIFFNHLPVGRGLLTEIPCGQILPTLCELWSRVRCSRLLPSSRWPSGSAPIRQSSV